MKKLNFAIICFSLLFLANIFLYLYKPLGENFFIIGDAIVIFLSFLAFISGIYAFKLHGFKSLQGKALLYLSIGIFFWFLGETTWGIYEIFLGIKSPFASLADVFWLIGYPFFLIGLYSLRRLSCSPIKKAKLLFLILIAIFICSFMLYLAFPNLTSSELSIQEKFSTSGYVIGDMLILVFLTFATTNLLQAKTFKAYSLIIVAIMLMSLADIYYMNFSEVYEVGNLIDLAWNLGYILLALGFLYHRETIKNLLKK
jgi:hypothetical protein